MFQYTIALRNAYAIAYENDNYIENDRKMIRNV